MRICCNLSVEYLKKVVNPITKNKFSCVWLSAGLVIGQSAYTAEADCKPLPDVEGDVLVALVSSSGANALLQINFADDEVCTSQSRSVDFDIATSVNFHVNADLDELAVQGVVEGHETWLRVDSEYSGELLLDRATAEGLDLTAAEFLGDNSQLEAADFFIEYVDSFEIGEFALRNVETNIPLLEVPYDHYIDRDSKLEMSAPEAAFLTVGSIGAAVLEELVITLDIANQQMTMTEAK